MNTFKKYWTQSKIFEHGQKIFEPADGLGINEVSPISDLIKKTDTVKVERYHVIWPKQINVDIKVCSTLKVLIKNNFTIG